MKRFGLGCLGVFAVFAVLFVTVIGPWPTYDDSKYRDARYYAKAVAGIEANAAKNDLTDSPGRLQAGWAHRNITPRIGIPLAGYGARGMSHQSTGVRDELYVKVLALSDGRDTAVLVGADMLITPPNLAAMVRERVTAEIPLSENEILFNASHTHCGPGGLGKGLAMRVTAAQYAAEVPEMLATAYTEAIVAAYRDLAPAKIAHGVMDAPEYIRNRTRRDGVTDPDLSWAVLEKEGGQRCYLASYSAHPTIFGGRMMEFSAEYPGALRDRIERETGAATVYLGGAVGSMGPRAPDAPTEGERVDLMGRALADLILAATQTLEFKEQADVAAIGLAIGMPPIQLRPFPNNTRWRLSPLVAKIAFAPYKLEGWIHGVRVGDLVFMGMPADFSGEISVEWKAWAANRGFQVWNLSFCGTYCGYFSPDRYYKDLPLGYETGMMSWFGPNVEAYFTDLFQHIVKSMAPPGHVF